ncbi:MAG: fluoride efflux transporter CrcB [Bacteroidetes bacterium]|nr:MAG: fluoride efflux transporter CrcB [Bacteroidota bacterium]RLD96199.1 MAG: fluoride efflux transporter CrcB [Bacteroidota bacterium]
MLKQLLLIGAGGFIGSVARFLISRLNTRIDWLSIPIGTLTVNVLGSLLIGFLIGISEKSPVLTVEWRMFLMVGLCGGFTTFSSFTGENLVLLKNGQILPLLLYTALSVFLGFAAVYLGYISTKLMA